MIDGASQALEAVQVGFSSLAKPGKGDRGARDLPVWGQGREYTIIHTSRCGWMNTLSQVKRSIHKCTEKAPGFPNIGPDVLWDLLS